MLLGLKADPTASIIPNGDFTRGNVDFVSERRYREPAENCLWEGNYTITARFDSPFQLHTNVARQPFSAPRGGNMLYMNSGRSEMFTVWATTVKVRPHTRYRVSFQEIGLSRGRYWRNLYEIHMNENRNMPQLGGDMEFVTLQREWDSGRARRVTIELVRLPNAHGGGIIGIGNIEMVPIPRA
jgi:hypothetical protein